MIKSNLSLEEAIKVLEDWQEQKDSWRLVSVIDFALRPQSTQFMLSVDLYIAGMYENRLDGKTNYFYGSIVDCINQAVDKIEEIRNDLRERI